MTARLFVRNGDGDMEEVLTMPREGWEVKESAEEGNSESSTIAIPDPEGELDLIPHRRAIIYEDESEADDQVLYSGFVTSDDLGRENGEHAEFTGTSRVVNLTVNDMNTLFDQRVMTGSDADRPEETDVERLTAIAGSEEMGYFDDLTLISSDDPETMEARDCTGQTPKQLFDECAQDTDKNYWIGATGNVTDGTDIFLWYGDPGLDAYVSPLSLSNDPDDLIEADMVDGSATTWPLGANTQRKRTGERIYSGVLVEYEGGRKYRKRDATKALYTLSGRDLVHPAPEIKTEARAGRRADRLLLSLDEPDITVTTTVRLPKAKATQLRAGMLVNIKATHISELVHPGKVCRILNASIKPVSAGTEYDITIEAAPVFAAPWTCPLDPGISGTEGKTYPPLNGTVTDDDGNLWYSNSNHAFFPDGHEPWNGPHPNEGCHGLGFASYGTGGSPDSGSGNVASQFRFVIAGPGTIVFDLAGTATYLGVLKYHSAAGIQEEDSTTATAGQDITFTVGAMPEDADTCYRWVDVFANDGGSPTTMTLVGVTWTPA